MISLQVGSTKRNKAETGSWIQRTNEWLLKGRGVGNQSNCSGLRGATECLHFPFSLARTGEGNGKPLQGSCLENPRDGAAWWAAVYGVAQSRTRLKRLSSSSKGYKPPVIKTSHGDVMYNIRNYSSNIAVPFNEDQWLVGMLSW